MAHGVVARVVLIATLALATVACTDADPPAVATSEPAAGVASSSAAPTTSTTSPPPDLQSVVDTFVASQRVTFSVGATDLSTGTRATPLSARRVRSASLYKLFVARELLRRIYAGTLRRDAAAGDSQGRTV